MVKKLERYFSQNLGAEHIIFTGVARTAITVLLKALGLSSEDEVIVPAFICSAVGGAVIRSGAKPVYVDVDKNNFNVTIDGIKNILTERTKALIISHTYGFHQDAEIYRKLCDEKGLYLIEDCVSSFILDYSMGDKKIVGDAAVFSIYKMVVNTGGAFIATNNKELASNFRQELTKYKRDIGKIKFYRRLYSYFYSLFYSIFEIYGLKPPFYNNVVNFLKDYHRKQLTIDDGGCNVRVTMTNLEYFLTIVQLPLLKWHVSRRSKAGKLILEKLKPFDEMKFPIISLKNHAIRYLPLYFDSNSKGKFAESALKKGIPIVTPWTALAPLRESLRLSDNMLLFPLRPFTFSRDVGNLCEVLNEFKSDLT